MTFTLAPRYRRPSLLITPFSPESVGQEMTNLTGAAPGAGGSAGYPSANRALYFPFTLLDPFIIDKMFWANGTVVSGNVDVGVYDSASTPNRLVSTGTTAQATVSVLQEVNITNYTLSPGTYYLAIACDNVTATFWRTTQAAASLEVCGAAQQATAFVLPTTATFATIAGAYVPWFGISARSLAA